MPLTQALEGQRQGRGQGQMELYELETSMVYLVNPRPARAIKQEPASKAPSAPNSLQTIQKRPIASPYIQSLMPVRYRGFRKAV